MKLRRLAVRRLPGIPSPGFELDQFGDGINVIVGPNASGKTSLPRALRAALYASELPANALVDVEADLAGRDGLAGDENVLRVSRVGGAVSWSRNGQRIEGPPLPEHRFVSCYTLHIEDLLASDAGTDTDIARHIGRELAGGYDLGAIRETCGFLVPPRIGHKEAGELVAAESELRKVRQHQKELRHDEARLEALERERHEAEEAGRAADLVEQALHWLEKRRERRGLEERRAALAPDMDRLTGTEAGTLEQLRAERRELAADLDHAWAEHRTAERILTRTGLAGVMLDTDSITRMRPRLARLRQLEGELERERERMAEATAARGRVVRELGGDPGTGARLDPGTIHDVEQALAASRRTAADLRGAEAELTALSEPEGDCAGMRQERDAGRLRDARRELLRWLSAAPLRGADAGRPGRTVALAMLVAVAVVGGAVTGLLVHPVGFGLLAVAVAAAGWLVFRPDPGTNAGSLQREDAQRRYRTLGVGEPQRWEANAIEARLLALDDECVDALRHEEEARRRSAAERRREGLNAALEQERARIAEVARRVNFDPGTLDASFDRWLRLTEQYDRADAALCESQARRASVEREADILRAGIASFLAEHGEAPKGAFPDDARPHDAVPGGTARGGADDESAAGELPDCGIAGGPTPDVASPDGEIPGDTALDVVLPDGGARGSAALDDEPPEAEVFQQRLDRLAERVRQRDEARRDMAAACERQERCAADIARRDAAMAALYRSTGIEPGDEAELRRRLGHLEEWRRLDRGLAEARGAEEWLRNALAEHDELRAAAEADDEARLRRRREALAEQSERVVRLAEEITRIRTLVDQTASKRDLEEARARRQSAEDALRQRCDETNLAEIGAFLIDQVESEHVETSRPAVLRRAEDWFARFTRHQFELVMGPDAGGTFQALETATGERRALTELSTGTRMQLHLAVRIAFTLEAEKGRTPLPFFLDEALTTADPERFQAAAGSLARFAGEEGRQIFYLTAQPDEARYWAETAPVVIDLPESRRVGRAVAHPSEVALPPAAPRPPHPGDDSPEEYAVRVGVLPVRPWEPPATMHLYHLLRSELDLLWRLLCAGIDRLGPLSSLLGSDEAKLLLSPEEQSLLRLRTTGAEAWVEAWRIGRGRPVDRDALVASGAISTVFMERVTALAARVNGDARALLDALRAGDMPHFRTESRLKLEAWLLDAGHLDEADPFDVRALERRVAAVLSSCAISTETALAEAAYLVRSLSAGLPPGSTHSPASS